GEERVLAAHPAAVVLDADRSFRTRRGLDGDESAPRVDRVLDQLFRDRGGTVDDLPRPDLGNDGGIEDPNGRHLQGRFRTGISRGKRERNSAPWAPTTTSSSSPIRPCSGRWMLGSGV